MHKNHKYFSMLVLTLVFMLILLGCTTTKSEYSQLEEQLIIQINWDADDYLASVEDDSEDIISLRSIYYGSFSDENSSELMALFKVISPHIGGLDRTIAAIYDRDSLKIKSQKSFAADQVSVYLFSSASQKNNILFIGETTYQGVSNSQIELYEIVQEKWVSKSVSDVNFEDNYSYAVTDKKLLHVFNTIYDNNMKPTDNYMMTLFWSEQESKFVNSSLDNN